MTERMVYLDHAATTPADEAVVAAMLPYFTECYGNPSSIYRLGRASLEALDDSRAVVAEVLGCNAKEIIFTGGGSESDNLAIKGAALAAQRHGKGQHIITAATEHHAVLHACEYLQAFGFELTVLPVDSAGLVSPADLQAAIRPDTVLATIMYANNEMGTIQPLAELGAICREHGVLFHTDAVQAAGALSLNVGDLNVDLLTLSGHKFYGPKGVGALYVRRGVQVLSQVSGGGQERRRRAGTENVPGIVGFGTALRLAEERRPSYVEYCTALRTQLWTGMEQRIDNVRLNGHPTQRLANNVNVSIAGIEAESLLMLLDQAGISASSGSACSAGSLEASHVLHAIGLDDDAAHASVRLSVGKDTTADDIDYVLDHLPPVVERIRAITQHG